MPNNLPGAIFTRLGWATRVMRQLVVFRIIIEFANRTSAVALAIAVPTGSQLTVFSPPVRSLQAGGGDGSRSRHPSRRVQVPRVAEAAVQSCPLDLQLAVDFPVRWIG
jgi:hypothetical protein